MTHHSFITDFTFITKITVKVLARTHTPYTLYYTYINSFNSPNTVIGSDPHLLPPAHKTIPIYAIFIDVPRLLRKNPTFRDEIPLYARENPFTTPRRSRFYRDDR